MVKLARNGVPKEDRLFGFLIDLAAPLYWRDYFDLQELDREERVVEDLLFWVIHKSNGRVSRLSSNAGMQDIEREIRNAVRTVQNCGPGIKYYYALIRQNDKRFPHTIQRLASLIKQDEDSHTPLVHCKCSLLIDDNTPLPMSLQVVVDHIIKANPRLVYKGKCTFRDFARRFLLTIWHNKGIAHLSWQSLNALRGYPDAKDRMKVLKYKKLLAEAGLIHDDWETYVLRGISSCRYRLTDKAKRAFESDYQESQKSDLA